MENCFPAHTGGKTDRNLSEEASLSNRERRPYCLRRGRSDAGTCELIGVSAAHVYATEELLPLSYYERVSADVLSKRIKGNITADYADEDGYLVPFP